MVIKRDVTIAHIKRRLSLVSGQWLGASHP